LKNAAKRIFPAKFRFDTAENEPAKNLQNFAKAANFANFANFANRGRRARGVAHRSARVRTRPQSP
jgi:hypothetical protein